MKVGQLICRNEKASADSIIWREFSSNHDKALNITQKVQNHSTKNRVCVIAPYCPADRDGLKSLGGAAKMSAVIQGMGENNFQVLLVNSGHQLEISKCTSVKRTKIGSQSCIEVEPPTIRKRSIGKLLQCFIAPLVMARIVYRWKPDYLWIYNSYLFEVICLCVAKLASPGLVTILELEDLPNARRRERERLTKNILDRFALKVALKIVNGATVVQKKMTPFNGGHQLEWYLPVLLSNAEIDGPIKVRNPITIGYFGGLMEEKGVIILISLIRQYRGCCRWVVCGSGPLERELETLSVAIPDRFRFFGCLEDQQFRAVYREVDAIINLHQPIEKFAGSLFPYKLLEAVAHGKLVISTPMLGCPDEASHAIHWLDGDPFEAGLNALARIEEIELETRAARNQAQKWVVANFSSRSAIGRILHDLQSVS